MTKFNYSLNTDSYTWKKAFLWGIFEGHLKKATEGSWSNRISHGLIALTEVLPIIGQIVSICEKLIVTNFGTTSEKNNRDLSQNKIVSEDPSALSQKIDKQFFSSTPTQAFTPKEPSDDKKESSSSPKLLLEADEEKTSPGAISTVKMEFDATKTEDYTSDQHFYKTADHWQFLEGILDEYAQAIQSKDPIWTNEKASNFLYTELIRIQSGMVDLVREAQGLVALHNHKAELSQVSIQDLQQLQTLIKNTSDLDITYKRLLDILVSRLPIRLDPKTVIGFTNDGNTCYINAALQPLLAINNFPDLVPAEIQQNENESNESFEGRQNILASFKILVNSWKNRSTPNELGKLIGRLRKKIFTAGLQEGGFMDPRAERDFQDAGSFYDLILHVIGKRFQLRNIRTFPLPKGGTKSVGETEPQGVLLLKEKNGSVQDKINTLVMAQAELHADDALKYIVNGIETKLRKFTETNTIVGEPQDLFVLRVENHHVDPTRDKRIDCRILFDHLRENAANYELVGFSQNHNELHWTSVIVNGDGWFYCDDSRVEKIETGDVRFTYPANYLVYKRVH